MTSTKSERRRGRPPKALGGQSDTRSALLRAGVIALTEKGFSSTGVEEILRSADVPKGSFYHYFDSKEDFGGRLIDEYALYYSKRLDRFFLDESKAPLARLQAFILDSRNGMIKFDFTRGCLIGNLGQEMGSLPMTFRQRLIDVFQDWQARTAACLVAAQSAGEIGVDVDCTKLAEFFWIGWEGAVLRAKLERNAAPLDRFVQGYFVLVSKSSQRGG
jgi:TetR/AcrR family transcriptional regulator, transcriptional repressor for nem operon